MLDTLAMILAPQGIKTVTTGGDEIARFLQARYGSLKEEAVQAVWRRQLERLTAAKVVMLGVPMDAGAGFERGSFKGPLALRTKLLHDKKVWEAMEAAGVVDVGDVRINPHLISDDTCSPELVADVREARGWGGATLPVSPHSILNLALWTIGKINPGAKVLVLGGDHSISRVPVEVLMRHSATKDLGVLHFDAHTDLLSRRDGMTHNFATWAYWANEQIGRGGRLQQVGLRVSGREKAYWEETLGLKQFWAKEVMEDPEAVAAAVVENLQNAGVKRLYISNDIDATDPRWAASTGTMEHGGLSPQVVRMLIQRVSEPFEVVGADVVEVAPPLKWHVPGEPARTIATACGYVLAQVDAMCGTQLQEMIPVPEPASQAQVSGVPPWV